MKPCITCTLWGVAIGMAAACILMVKSPKFRKMVQKGEAAIEKKMQE